VVELVNITKNKDGGVRWRRRREISTARRLTFEVLQAPIILDSNNTKTKVASPYASRRVWSILKTIVSEAEEKKTYSLYRQPTCMDCIRRRN